MMDQCVWLLIRVLREKGILTETEFSWLNNAWSLQMENIARMSEEDQRAFVRDFIMQIPFEEYRKTLPKEDTPVDPRPLPQAE